MHTSLAYEEERTVLKQPEFFVVLAGHKPILDRFDQHFRATLHLPLTNAGDKPQQQRQFSL